MRPTLLLACLVLSGCANSNANRKPITSPTPTPTVREFQSKMSREREAAAIESANLPVEGQLIR